MIVNYSLHIAWIREDGKQTRVIRPVGLNRQSGTKKNKTIRHQNELALKKTDPEKKTVERKENT